MKNKTLIITAMVIVIAASLAMRYRARQTSVTPGALVTPTEGSSVTTGSPAPNEPAGGSSTKISLSISSPPNGATVTRSSLTVRGKTAANAEVFVNELETKADASGNFSISVTLDEGENYIIVMANDAAGNVAEAELTVTYNP